MKRLAGLSGPVAGVVFFALAFVLGWSFATALVGGAFTMLAGTLCAWAGYRFSQFSKEERE